MWVSQPTGSLPFSLATGSPERARSKALRACSRFWPAWSAATGHKPLPFDPCLFGIGL